MNKKMNKRGQLTIFIIIAIVLVVVLVIVLWPRLKTLVVKTDTPQAYLQNCLEKDAGDAVKLASARGGSINPVHGIMFNGEKIEYLCYTNEYYDTCTTQQPMLKQHFEYEVSKAVENKVASCISSFKSDFESRGYSVSVGSISSSTEIVPENVNININAPITIAKGEDIQKQDRVKINIKSKIYNLLMISTSILNWEARYGDSAPESFMMYYPNLKIEKLKQGDGSKIYILTDLTNKDSFTFASRSLSWPAGYGIGEKVST